MTRTRALRKRASHRLKAAIFRREALDLWLDQGSRRLGGITRSAWLRLFPERRQTIWPFEELSARNHRGRALILSLVPPEDTGGSSRPARLAVELHRRGYAIDWRWALDIYPTPAALSHKSAGVEARSLQQPAAVPEPDFVIVEAPHRAFTAILDRLPVRTPVLFEQIDAWTGDLASGWYRRDAEDGILARATALAATAEPLARELRERTGRPCVLLPNAVDSALFDPRTTHRRPAGLEAGRPTIVFVGALWGDWIDLEAIDALARARPQAAIHLVGRCGDRPLPSHHNLHILGERPRDEIPAWLQHADVALVPFREGTVATATSPLKAYEALAMGCPVAATATPEIFDTSGVIGGPGIDLTAATDAAAELRISVETAIRFAEANSWSARVDQLLELVKPG